MEGLAIGRIVHFVGINPDHSAAIVTRVVDKEKGIVNLTVFHDLEDELSVRNEVPYQEEKTNAHSWHWPERA